MKISIVAAFVLSAAEATEATEEATGSDMVTTVNYHSSGSL